MASTVANTNDILSRIPEDIWDIAMSEFARYLIRRGIHEHEIKPYKLDMEYLALFNCYSITVCVRDYCKQQHYYKFIVDAIDVRT